VKSEERGRGDKIGARRGGKGVKRGIMWGIFIKIRKKWGENKENRDNCNYLQV
jgi:hypothetical protein